MDETDEMVQNMLAEAKASRDMRGRLLDSEHRVAAVFKPYIVRGWQSGDQITLEHVDGTEPAVSGLYMQTTLEHLSGSIRVRTPRGWGVNYPVTEWIFTNVTKKDRE